MALSRERYTKFYDPGSGLTKRRRLEMVRTALWNERSTHEAHWRDLSDFIKPRRPRWTLTDKNKGDRRNQKIIDSTATFASRTLQSGMHAGMSNPSRPWAKLATGDPELNEFGPVKDWLHVVTQRLLSVFIQTNLYQTLPTHYGDMAVFATGATAIMDDDQDLFRSYNYPIGTYAIGQNARGLVDQWVYETRLSLIEIVQRFLLDARTNMIDWSNASMALRNAWERAQYHDMIDICWVIMPNFERDDRKLESKFLPYYSCHFEKGQDREDVFLRESGFREFPILVSRWDVSGDDWWGTECPGMVCLGDVKQLQTGERRSAQAVEKMLNPPLQAPTQVRNQKASLLPGDITYNDVREGQKGITPIHETAMPIDKLEFKQEQCRHRIRRAFYEDLFLMLANSDPQRGMQPPTAREIAERHEEKLFAIGPVLERTADEVHDPLFDRAFAMADRMGFIPLPPRELQGVNLKVEYTSVLAQAMKLVGVSGHERFLQGATAMVELFPQVRHKINVFQAVDDYAEMLGVNPKVVVPDGEAQAALNAEAQAQRAAAIAERAQPVARAAKDLSETDVEKESALKRIVEGVTA